MRLDQKFWSLQIHVGGHVGLHVGGGGEDNWQRSSFACRGELHIMHIICEGGYGTALYKHHIETYV